MTALAAAEPVPLRPVRWTRLAWVTWRRYRTTLAATVGVLAVLAAYLLISGERVRSAYASVTACTPVHSARYAFVFQTFHESYGQSGFLGVVLLFPPGLVGAFAGEYDKPLFDTGSCPSANSR